MSNIFISYERESNSIVSVLAKDIGALGHSVWFDNDLGGGQSWWDQILRQILQCEVFVFALSSRSLESTACASEYEYAHALGKPILPVLIEKGVSIHLLPEALTQIQFVDYLQPKDKACVLSVGRALNTMPIKTTLPEPLPSPPEVPTSYMGKLARRVATAEQSYQEQTVLVADIRESLRDLANREDSIALLKTLRRRRDLYASTEREIDELLQNASILKATKKDQLLVEEQSHDISAKTAKEIGVLHTRQSKTKQVNLEEPHDEDSEQKFWARLYDRKAATLTGFLIGLAFVSAVYIKEFAIDNELGIRLVDFDLEILFNYFLAPWGQAIAGMTVAGFLAGSVDRFGWRALSLGGSILGIIWTVYIAEDGWLRYSLLYGVPQGSIVGVLVLIGTKFLFRKTV